MTSLCTGCGFDLARVDDITLAVLGVCSETCLVHGPADPSIDDEWREPVDEDEDDLDPNAGGGNLDG